MLRILNYIIKNNASYKIIFYLFNAFFYQIFKRLTRRIISKKIFNGKQIFLFPNCNISTFFVYTDIPDRKEIFQLRKTAKSLSKPCIFLDIGANIGAYSICMMDLCKEVFAFEPHPFTAMRCKMNFLLNGKNESYV